MALYIPDIKLLFIHNPKTAGMSIRHSLMSNSNLQLGAKAVEIGEVHNGVKEVIELKGSQFLDSCLSFGVVRNPYDWVVSYYNFTKSSNEHPDYELVKDMSFTEYVDFLCDAILSRRTISTGRYMTQSDALCIDKNKKGVNVILRHEKLQDDWNLIGLFLGEKLPLRHINSSYLETPYDRYYNNRLREMIGLVFQDDFINFNYKFQHLSG